MDAMQMLALVSGVLSLAATSVGLANSLYEIRKLKAELQRLQKPKGDELILRPTLDEVLRFQGDIRKYAERAKQTNNTAIPFGGIEVVFRLIFANFATMITLQLPASCEISQFVFNGLKWQARILRVSVFCTIVILTVLSYFGPSIAIPMSFDDLPPLPNGRPIPGWLVKPCVSVLFAYLLTELYFRFITKRIGMEK